ncbi:condensation domain-containing protein [Micromonosporaceae bacterium DT194]|uniref:condensation domain-containing protein n=1 Tax=Melissospora conviva TaxID=3388432 RepID=UPI003C260AEC
MNLRIHDRLPFQGDRSLTVALTWGQRAMWPTAAAFANPHTAVNLSRTVPLSARLDVDLPRVGQALAALVGRHESLRTRIRLVDGELRQVTAARGRLPLLTVVADAPDPDGARTAARVRQWWGPQPFDHGAEWPLRAVAVLVDGRVRQLVLVFDHSVVDFHAVEILLRELRLLLVRGVVTTAAGLQSADVAMREREAQRWRSARAVAYWVREFGLLPAGPFGEAARVPGGGMGSGPSGPARGPSPRYCQGTLVSGAVEAASRLLAIRYRTSTATAILAATAAVSAARAGAQTSGVMTMANNRFPPGYAEVISKLNQIGLCRVDLTGRPDFAELLARTRRGALAGYRHAYYDPAALAHAFAGEDNDLATALAPFCCLNDIRLPRPEPVSLPGGDTATPGTFTWADPPAAFGWRCRIQIVDGVPGTLGLVITADTRYLPAEQAEGLLREIEAFLVAAACDAAPRRCGSDMT